jgi:hypothetical protein
MVRRAETRPRNISPEVAHERAVKGALARTTPEYHLRKLAEAIPKLTEAQLARFTALVLMHAAGQSGPGDGEGEAA